jgi:hypothetical protein
MCKDNIGDENIVLYSILSNRWDINDDLYIVAPSLTDRLYAARLYVKIFEEHKKENAYTSEEMLGVLKQEGLWTNEDGKRFDKLKKIIDDTKMELYQLKVSFKKLDKCRTKLKNLKEEFFTLYVKQNTYTESTCEFAARYFKMLYLLWSGLRNKNNVNPYAEFYQIGEEIINLMFTTHYNNQIPDTTLRKIARSNEWKGYWGAVKSGVQCFSAPFMENFFTLLQWTRFYDSIIESVDCPSDDIIEDDDLLDGWMLFNRKKREDEKKKAALDEKGHGQKGDALFIMAEDQEHADQIYQMNDMAAKQMIKSRLDTAVTGKTILEANMPDKQFELQLQKNKMMSGG